MERLTDQPKRDAICTNCGRRSRVAALPSACPRCGDGPVVRRDHRQRRLRERRAARRWPMQPLLDVLGMNQSQLHRHIPFSRGRASREGFTDAQADRFCIHFGLHPIQVWGWDWVTVGLDTPDSAEAAFEHLRLHRDSAA